MCLPEVSICRAGEESYLTVNLVVGPGDDLDAAAERAEGRVSGLRKAPLALIDPHRTERPEIRGARPAGDFEQAVSEATERIGAGDLEKVVLAREVVVTAPSAHDPAAVFGALREHFPSCFCFCCGTPEAAFLAASPELLIRRSGASASTVALAGSTRRSSDPSIDDHLGEQLLRSDKDCREHRIVAEEIVRKLRPHSVWVEAAEEPEVIRVANIQHLATPVIAQLAEPLSAISLAGLLHPTPAVGGEPGPAAAETIRELEGMDRGWYAGPGRLDGRDRGRRILRRPPQRPASRPRRRTSTPAAASSPAPTRPPSWPRPRSSSRRCCRCWRSDRASSESSRRLAAVVLRLLVGAATAAACPRARGSPSSAKPHGLTH